MFDGRKLYTWEKTNRLFPFNTKDEKAGRLFSKNMKFPLLRVFHCEWKTNSTRNYSIQPLVRYGLRNICMERNHLLSARFVCPVTGCPEKKSAKPGKRKRVEEETESEEVAELEGEKKRLPKARRRTMHRSCM